MIKKILLFTIVSIIAFAGIIILKITFIGKNLDVENCKPYILKAQHQKDIKLTFLGTSCFIVEYKGKQFVSDAFFSNPSIPSVLLGNMKNQDLSAKINKNLFSNVSMTSVSHGHYDHCFDLEQILNPETTIVADSSIFNQLNSITKNNKNQIALDFSPQIQWIYSYDSIFRVFPILSKHGPHFGKTVLFKGSYGQPIDEFPNKLWQWKLGKGNYSFLLDVIDADSILFRMALLYGNIDESEYAKIKAIYNTQKCDVATSVFWNKKLNEPQLKLAKENTNADVILLNHWNNFFRSNKKSLQQLRSSKLEKELKEFSDEKMPVYIMLPFTTVEL